MLAASKMVVIVSCKNCGKGFRLTAVRIDSEESLKTNSFSNAITRPLKSIAIFSLQFVIRIDIIR
jgi:hypothetical protein